MPDANVLVYAHRADDPAHDFYRNWLEEKVNSASPFALSSEVLAAFVRIVTHPRFPGGPTPLPAALAEMDALISRSNCRLLHSSAPGWEIFRRLCLKSGAVGKLVADARHAAIAIENGCTWVTRDRDFDRFISVGLQLHIIEPPES
ncbi:type II toxin-antitoxin system VapC family toxin [Opitutaceae bacterium]|nr:type II toxin-antitoxin system VapC family toxin [Opitutaceae bacterium]